MNYDYCAMEKRDYNRIDKLNNLTNIDTFYNDVRKLTKNVMSDHAIHRWQCLAEVREEELMTGYEKYYQFIGWDKDYMPRYELRRRLIEN